MTKLYEIDHKEVSNAVVRIIKAVKDMIKKIEVTSTNDKTVKDIIVTKTVDNIINELHIAFQYNRDHEYPEVDTLKAKLLNLFECEDSSYDSLSILIKEMYYDRLIAENNRLDARAGLVRAALKKLNEEEKDVEEYV